MENHAGRPGSKDRKNGFGEAYVDDSYMTDRLMRTGS